MMITRDNYEPFFLDYLEGNLDESMIDQFLDFLENNPDLKEELQLFENVHLPEEQIVFQEKGKLYKSTADAKTAMETKTIAYIEGDLDDEERKSFENYLAVHPELHKEYALFEKTRLRPDLKIQYPEKKKLYKKSGTVVLMNWAARAAAVLVLVWGINSLITQPVTQDGIKQMAEVNTKTTPEVKKNEQEKKIQEPETQEKLKTTKETKPEKTKSLREQTKGRLQETRPAEPKTAERELIALAQITPIQARLDQEPMLADLAVSGAVKTEKLNDPKNSMSVEEFLAIRAKKVGSEGLSSAQRLVRTGLGIASELSGERIGYSVKDGKISSLEFESKLMAFSIPLKKY